MKQVLGFRHGRQTRCGNRARRFTIDRDIIGIAPEGFDIVVHPFQGQQLVQQTKLCRLFEIRPELRQIEEAKRSHAVLNAHMHDVPTGRCGRAFICGFTCTAKG